MIRREVREVPLALTEVRRVRSHRLCERCRERQNLVIHIDGCNCILCLILRIRYDDGQNLPLELEVVEERIAGGCILRREDVGHARHALSL